jgi:putative transposase
LTLTHTQRWHAHHHTTGTGHLYQGRFKSFPVQTDDHLLTVCRYVERNPVRAGLVSHAELWRWGSLWRRVHGGGDGQGLLSRWPIDPPEEWVQWVNNPLAPEELQALRRCVNRGQPCGDVDWQQQTAAQLGLSSTLRPRGRPQKATPQNESGEKKVSRRS